MAKKPPDWALGPHTDVCEGVEVRLNEDGTIDEIVTSRPISHFHLEQMDDDQYWFCFRFADSDDRQHVMISRKGKHIYPTVYQ